MSVARWHQICRKLWYARVVDCNSVTKLSFPIVTFWPLSKCLFYSLSQVKKAVLWVGENIGWQVVGDTNYIDSKMRVVCSIKSLHLAIMAQISFLSQPNLCPQPLLSPCKILPHYTFALGICIWVSFPQNWLICRHLQFSATSRRRPNEKPVTACMCNLLSGY